MLTILDAYICCLLYVCMGICMKFLSCYSIPRLYRKRQLPTGKCLPLFTENCDYRVGCISYLLNLSYSTFSTGWDWTDTTRHGWTEWIKGKLYNTKSGFGPQYDCDAKERRARANRQTCPLAERGPEAGHMIMRHRENYSRHNRHFKRPSIKSSLTPEIEVDLVLVSNST